MFQGIDKKGDVIMIISSSLKSTLHIILSEYYPQDFLTCSHTILTASDRGLHSRTRLVHLPFQYSSSLYSIYQFSQLVGKNWLKTFRFRKIGRSVDFNIHFRFPKVAHASTILRKSSPVLLSLSIRSSWLKYFNDKVFSILFSFM